MQQQQQQQQLERSNCIPQVSSDRLTNIAYSIIAGGCIGPAGMGHGRQGAARWRTAARGLLCLAVIAAAAGQCLASSNAQQQAGG
jgi:hypothetical protein